MASGILGRLDLLEIVDNIVYTVPVAPTTVATVNILICNRAAASITVDVAISTAAPPQPSDYIEFGVTIIANGVLERTGIAIGSGNMIVVKPSLPGMSCIVTGFEE